MKAAIVELLTENLNGAALSLNNRSARFAVTGWYTPACMQKDFLQNQRVDVLFSVKLADEAFSRFHQQKPHIDTVGFEVGIWLIDTPSYSRSVKDSLRDAAVEEVKRVFNANPAVGSLKGVKVDDHAKGCLWVLCSTVTVTHTLHG